MFQRSTRLTWHVRVAENQDVRHGSTPDDVRMATCDQFGKTTPGIELQVSDTVQFRI